MKKQNTKKKLREASFFLGHLRTTADALSTTSRAILTNPEEFEFFLSAFLSAARSVIFTLQKRRDDEFVIKELEAWLKTRSKSEKKVFDFMTRRRNASVHRGTTEHRTKKETKSLTFLEASMLSPTRGHLSYYGFQYFGPPGVELPTIIRKARHFKFKLDGREEEVVATCSRYITLIEQFVSDFTTAHP